MRKTCSKAKTWANPLLKEFPMKWTDTREIAIALFEKFPDTDPLTLRFTDLHRYVTELSGFDDDLKRSNEKILESIQMNWLDERD